MATPNKPTAGRKGRGGRGGGRGGRGGKKAAAAKKTWAAAAQQQDPKQPPPPPTPEEIARQEELRRQEAEERERKRQEEEAQRLLDEKETAIRDATKILKDVWLGSNEKSELRNIFRVPENLKTKRADFAKEKKTLKADLKKCTAFVKKVKAGSLYTAKPIDVKTDVAALNLSRYVEEIISALIESKPKVADLPNVSALCQAMHERYPEFLSTLLPSLWTTVLQSPASQSNKTKKGPSEIAEQSKQRRFYVRLLTEFLECGMLPSADKLLKCLSDWTGAANSYAVQDAIAIVAFGKQATFECLGQTPMSVRTAMELIRAERANAANAPETLRVLLDDASTVIQQVKPVLAQHRAVPPETAAALLQHCLGAYTTMSTSLVQTHTKLRKLEKRCEQDRLLSGQLPAAREKGLVDARKLCESLQKSVEALSDSLDQPVPVLLVEDDDLDAARGSGVEIWTKEAGGQENLGPFDDEETRAFYCDVPDFLTTIPPALLGITEDEIERRNKANAEKYGADGPTETQEGGSEAVDMPSEDQLDAVESGDLAEEDEEEVKTNDTAEGENKDAPHYKLSLLLEQELPECNRREQVDELSEKFCSNHGSSKNSRKRLVKTLFLVPRARVDLLPFYARMTTTLDKVWNDVGPSLVKDLEQQFHGQAKFKKNQNLEARMRTARYIGELTKFKAAPPIVALRCLHRCVEDFTGNNVDVACCMLESCGRYLYRMAHTNPRLTSLMETMTRLSKAKHHDERLQSLLKAAFFSVNPPPSGPKKKAKQYPPLEAYLRYLLLVKLEPSDSVVSSVTKQLVRLPWNDPSCNCGALLCRLMLKACRKGRYKSIEAVAAVAARLRTQRSAGETTIRLIDAVLDELSWALDNPSYRDQQRTITYVRLLGELYRTNQVVGHIIIEQLYDFINTGHAIPEALRAASKKYETEDVAPEEATGPVYNSAGGLTHTIQEDEEVEESELETKLEDDDLPKPVAVSSHSKFDPRVTTVKDPPSSSYRITLVCTLLEIVSKNLISRNNLPRLRGFLSAFQRYLFTKTALPTDVEFTLLDTFDIVDSQWRRVTKNMGRGGNQNSESGPDSGFPRYANWIDAHNATIQVEETEAQLDLQRRAHLEALADETKSLADVHSMVDDEEDDDDDATMSIKSKDSTADIGLLGDDDDDEHSWGSEEEDEDDQDSDETEGDSEEDDEEEEFDEEAYMLQMEEEAFERELRRVTMDALEKGKNASRKLVGDSMISGSQGVKKKTIESSAKPEAAPNQGFTLEGEAGISFQVLKRGNKGKVEAKELLVPVGTNLAKVASRQDDAAARERDVIKQRVLCYEEKSAESELTGGNVYLEQEKLQRNRNKTLSMADIDKNFGTTGGSLLPEQLDKKPSAAQVQHVYGGSRANPVGGRGRIPGRPISGGRGRGRSSTSGRGLL